METQKQLAKSSTTSEHLLMNTLQQKEPTKIVTIECGLTIQKALDAKPIIELVRDAGEGDVIMAISGAIMVSMEYFNINNKINEVQSLQIASLFISEYGAESLEDLMICLRNAKLGKYGKTFNRIDGETVFVWFREYLSEKYEALEQRLEHKKKTYLDVDFAPEIMQSVTEKIRSQPSKKNIPKNAPTMEQHFMTFKETLKVMTITELNEALTDYKKAEQGNVRAQFGNFVKAIENEIKTR